MIYRSAYCLSLVALLFWPIQTQEAAFELTLLEEPELIDSPAVTTYLNTLETRGVDLDDQGIRIESLDARRIFADHHGDRAFNPASVIKVATSMAALERFGPDHRFSTAFYTDGEIAEDGVLEGDLILASDGDPEMDTNDLVRLAREVIRAGVREVRGELRVAGPFTVGNFHSEDRVAQYLTRTLRRIGIRVPDEVAYGPAPRGILVAERSSAPLRDLLFYQNARSDNVMADRLGEAVGGPRGVERYLINEVGIRDEDVHVARASGLRVNRITPAGTIMLLRRMVLWLEDSEMHPSEVMPIAGLDRGTLRLRFANQSLRGAVVAKTGTLITTDSGVSTLAGILYTEDHGPLLFAIFNSRGPVLEYRRFQDVFVRDLLVETGGMALANAAAYRSGN